MSPDELALGFQHEIQKIKLAFILFSTNQPITAQLTIMEYWKKTVSLKIEKSASLELTLSLSWAFSTNADTNLVHFNLQELAHEQRIQTTDSWARLGPHDIQKTKWSGTTQTHFPNFASNSLQVWLKWNEQNIDRSFQKVFFQFMSQCQLSFITLFKVSTRTLLQYF